MSCHCICHETEFMLNKLASPYGCPTCHDFHTALSQDVPLTPDNVRAIIAETTTHTDVPYDAVIYYFRIKTTPYAMNDVMVKVAVASSLAQQSWLGGEELAHQHLCSHLKKEWKNGQPPWVRLTLAEYALKKPQVGGAAMLAFQNQWTQMQGHPSYYGQNVGGDVVTNDLQTWLPGLNEAAQCPAPRRRRPDTCVCAGNAMCFCPPVEDGRCEKLDSVERMIVHLNDGHRWKRAQIADWLESLDVDLTFGAEPPPKPVLPPADRGQRLVIIANTIAMAQREAYRRRRGPSDCLLISTQGGHSHQQLRGMHGIQYCVVQGTVVIPPLKELILAQRFVEVGEEDGGAPAHAKHLLELQKYQNQMAADAQLLAKINQLEQYAAPPKSLHGSFIDEFVAEEKFSLKKSKWVEFVIKKSANVDPWPGEHVPFHEPEADPKAKALDAKKKNSHTAFTVNPTKKNPFKK